MVYYDRVLDKIIIQGRMPFYQIPFGPTLISGKVVTVSAGKYRVHGGEWMTYAGGTVTLSGNPETIYVQHVRGSGAITLQHATTPAEDNMGNVVVIPLHTWVGTGASYRMTALHHMGDIDFDLAGGDDY